MALSSATTTRGVRCRPSVRALTAGKSRSTTRSCTRCSPASNASATWTPLAATITLVVATSASSPLSTRYLTSLKCAPAPFHTSRKTSLPRTCKKLCSRTPTTSKSSSTTSTRARSAQTNSCKLFQATMRTSSTVSVTAAPSKATTSTNCACISNSDRTRPWCALQLPKISLRVFP